MHTLQLFALAPLAAMLGIAAFIDWRERRIPNWLTFPMIVSGLAGSFLPGHFISPSDAFIGLGIGVGIPLALFLLGAVGGGDVKLLAAVGAWVGGWAVFKIFLIECIVGMIIVIVQSIRAKKLSALVKNSAILTVSLVNIDTIGADAVYETGQACRSIERPLPYAVPVAIAFLIVLIAGI